MGIPKIDESVFLAQGAVVVGNVEIGENGSVWYNAVIRADGNRCSIGKNVNIQDCVVIHGDEDVTIEDNVSLGHSCVIHGATIKKNALIGMGAVVMDNAIVGENSIVAAGTLIPHGKVIPPNSLVMGSPGKVKRELTPEEIEGNLANAAVYIAMAKKNREGIWDRSPEDLRDEMIAKGEFKL